MQTLIYKRTKKGMTIVEAVIAVGIFSAVSVASYQIYVTVHNLATRADHKSKALMLAEEGIEATRSIRDQNFSSLTPGTKGLSLAGNVWSFLGTSDTSSGYIRSIVVSSVDADTRNVVSNVEWLERGATTTVALSTRLTDWHKVSSMASNLTIGTSASSLTNGNRTLTGITLSTNSNAGTTTISQIQMTWTTASRRLQQIQSPNTTTLFTGSLSSGQTATLSPTIALASNTANRPIQFVFSASVNNNTFTITFIMSDGSTKAVTIVK